MPSWAAPRGSAVRASLDVGSGEAASMDGTYGARVRRHSGAGSRVAVRAGHRPGGGNPRAGLALEPPDALECRRGWMPHEPTIGSIFAGHRIEAVAGRGGMGVVFRATDLALERPVALKLIAADAALDPVFRARFEHECRAAAAIDHPHAVEVFHARRGGRRPVRDDALRRRDRPRRAARRRQAARARAGGRHRRAGRRRARRRACARPRAPRRQAHERADRRTATAASTRS